MSHLGIQWRPHHLWHTLCGKVLQLDLIEASAPPLYFWSMLVFVKERLDLSLSVLAWVQGPVGRTLARRFCVGALLQ